METIWQEKGIISKLRAGPGRVAVLYLVGLVGCIIAGVREPLLFILSRCHVFLLSPHGTGVLRRQDWRLHSLSIGKPLCS